MKQLVFFLITAVAAAAWAQGKPEPKDAAKPEAAKPEAAKQEQPRKQAAATTRKPGKRWNEDARHCLQLPTNTEIIKCAEEYL